MADNNRATEERPKRARARAGCVRCRAKRRKCDEVKPVCGRCRDKKESCQWRARIVFREENNHGLSTPQSHPKTKKPSRPAPGCFEIQDVTAEVIRDQQQQRDLVEDSVTTADAESPATSRSSRTAHVANRAFEDEVHAWDIAAASNLFSALEENCPEMDGDYQQGVDSSIADATTDVTAVNDLSYVWPSPTALGLYDDSIFLPGSAYLDAHSTLRSHLINEVNTSGATRVGTPESLRDDKIEASVCSDAISREMSGQTSILTEEEEFSLLQNWVEEGQHPKLSTTIRTNGCSCTLDGQV